MTQGRVTKIAALLAALALFIWIIYRSTAGRLTATNLVVAAVVIPVVVIFVLIDLKIRRGAARKRSAALKKSAMLSGFSFQGDPDESLLATLAPGFELFTKGVGRSEFRNYMEGEVGGEGAVIFDFSYKIRTQGGENVTYKDVRQTVCILNQETRKLPNFQLRSKRLMDKAKDMAGFDDIDPENDPEFAKHCWLTGADEAAIRALFVPAVTQAFRDGNALHDIVVEGAGNRLMYYQIGHIKPEELTDFIAKASEVSHLFDQS